MVSEILKKLEGDMHQVLSSLEKDFSGLRVGRATPALLEPIEVEVYGGRMPLSQVGVISAPGPRLLTVQVWDTAVIAQVEKALRKASLNPVTEGAVLRVPLPDLTQERRQELAKMARQYTESAKVGVRTFRRQALDQCKKDPNVSEDIVRNSEKDIQKIIDTYSKKIEESFTNQEKIILQG